MKQKKLVLTLSVLFTVYCIVPSVWAKNLRFLALDAAGVKMGPFNGEPGSVFREHVQKMVDLYTADKSLNWGNTIKIGEAPKNSFGLGSTDLFASFCFRLCRDNGGNNYAQKLWREVGQRPPATSTQEAVDNFILAASVAANKNLTSLFTERWRWPMSDKARQEARERFSSRHD